VVATATSYCLQAVLATHLFTVAYHRCAKMVMAFSTALNLHGKFDAVVAIKEVKELLAY